ncbi:MAG TPA: chemotaxis protein CheW [Planctomycetes bacterium]|nr:chemotaxis protein CheW [Planctomycetota bacterium]
MSAATATSGTVAGTYLTFQVANEEYGIEILKVREIIGMLPITPVPGSPAVMQGVVNLRGKVIPVLSMRNRFNLQPGEPHEHNVIIVVDAGDGGQIGLAVDRVREVANFTAADTEPPPTYGMSIDASMVAALGKSQNRIRILLDLAKVLVSV